MKRLDLTDPVFRDNPQTVLNELRHAYPMIEEPAEDLVTGRTFRRWHLFRYREVSQMFRDRRFGNEIGMAVTPPAAIKEFVGAQRHMMLFRDPPDHTRLRSLVNRAFTPRMVEQLEPRIRQLAQELLKTMDPSRPLDMVDAFAFPLPVLVIAELLGVPKMDRGRVREWSRVFASALDVNTPFQTLETANQMVIEFRDYFRELVAERRLAPGPDLFSALLQVSDDDGSQLSLEELLDMGILLLVAGHETTRNLLANAVWLLARYPAEMVKLRQTPSLIGSGVEEVLRFEPPVMVVSRIVQADVEWDGHTLKTGDVAYGWVMAANRDESIFSDADCFDVGRQGNPHLSFAGGIHYCLGAPLARLEAKVALQELLVRYPTLTLDQPPEWLSSLTFRGPASLMVSARGPA